MLMNVLSSENLSLLLLFLLENFVVLGKLQVFWNTLLRQSPSLLVSFLGMNLRCPSILRWSLILVVFLSYSLKWSLDKRLSMIGFGVRFLLAWEWASMSMVRRTIERILVVLLHQLVEFLQLLKFFLKEHLVFVITL